MWTGVKFESNVYYINIIMCMVPYPCLDVKLEFFENISAWKVWVWQNEIFIIPLLNLNIENNWCSWQSRDLKFRFYIKKIEGQQNKITKNPLKCEIIFKNIVKTLQRH